MFSHLPERSSASSNVLLGKEKGAVHPSAVRLGLQMANSTLVGSNARCVGMLSVFTQIIDDYETGTVAGGHISRELMKVVSPSINFLSQCRAKSISMGNAITWFKQQVASRHGLQLQSRCRTPTAAVR